MKALSKEYDREFAKRFFKWCWLGLLAAAVIAMVVVLIVMVLIYGKKYGF